jgi:hypothetical protein
MAGEPRAGGTPRRQLRLRNPLGHGPGEEPIRTLSAEPADFAIETAMIWIKVANPPVCECGVNSANQSIVRPRR